MYVYTGLFYLYICLHGYAYMGLFHMCVCVYRGVEYIGPFYIVCV